MSLLPKSIHRCRRYPTTFNSGRDIPEPFQISTKSGTHSTQASFTTEASAVVLLFGLVASGQIRLRRIDGYQHLADVLAQGEVAA